MPLFQGALNVKLVRTTMLIFVALAWTFIVAAQSKKDSAASQNSNIFSVIQKSFPMFILWFVLMAGLNTIGVFSDTGVSFLSKCGKFLFSAALAGVGLKSSLKTVFSNGLKPIALGRCHMDMRCLVFVCVCFLPFRATLAKNH